MTNGDGCRQRHVFGATVLGLGGLGELGELGGLEGWELSLVLLPEQPLASSSEGLGPKLGRRPAGTTLDLQPSTTARNVNVPQSKTTL